MVSLRWEDMRLDTSILFSPLLAHAEDAEVKIVFFNLSWNLACP